MTKPPRALIAILEVKTNPAGALLTEMETKKQYVAPVKLNYQWDERYVVDNCLRVKGFYVSWPDGTSASTNDFVKMCDGPNSYNLIINKPKSISPSHSSESVPFKEVDLCSAISGAKVISEDGKYLGILTNKYSSDSIFNKYGTYGNKYGSDSIWNQYGSYGGKYSSYSPFNKYTSSPPMLIKNGEIVGYLTINKYKEGAVNPYIVRSCSFSGNTTSSDDTSSSYEIEAADNDENFLINGELFEAKTYCLGWDEGERVIFLEGSPNGICTSAKVYNLNREETCEVWCE